MLTIALFWLVLVWLLAIGALAVFNLALARLVEALVPPLGHFIDIDGLRLHLVDSGAKPGQAEPPLVFIHGLLGQLNHFAFALAARFPERRIVLIDRPGSGYSWTARPQNIKAQAGIVARIIERLGLKTPVVVGHSFGGAIALALALDHPDQVGGLALIAPLTQVVVDPPEPLALLYKRSRLSLWLAAWTLAPFATLLRARAAPSVVFAPDPMPPGFWTRGGNLLGARPAALLAAASDVVTQPGELPDMVRRYDALDLPIGVLFGSGDRVLDPRGQGAGFCALAPGAVLTSSDGGHMLPVTRPEETETFIRNVLARLAPQTFKGA